MLETDHTTKRKLLRTMAKGKKQTIVLFVEYAQQGWQWRAYNLKDARPLAQLTQYTMLIRDRIRSGSADDLDDAKAKVQAFAKEKLRPSRVRFRWEEVKLRAV